jgi:hypothetical protein
MQNDRNARSTIRPWRSVRSVTRVPDNLAPPLTLSVATIGSCRPLPEAALIVCDTGVPFLVALLYCILSSTESSWSMALAARRSADANPSVNRL